ncbi:3-oxoacyl-[acyl-carrier-protein] synthase III C-terminal domain-containing protein [Shivajiella indica]|uniref:3-oxoacyl-[acyl-carrier-protein] synthase III C-terminal domain-containing protein n=1 Tax=Shivajiella indica TaxID=872115 RepID=A0ABW5B716_9BACT
MGKKENILIESIGTYLPPKSISTQEVLQACKNQIRFPLEKISGIKTRRMAGEEEFSIDLARKAISECLKDSKYSPEEIDLLICCNISRVDKPDLQSFEPCTAVKLKKEFAFLNALAFDITNACAGMFTGVYIAKALMETKAVKKAMIVSGEYITHLTLTAQREAENYMDSRLACLTLGDAGAAVVLESTSNDQIGFVALDLQTFGRYSPYCIAKTSDQGGWIMLTDSVNLTDAGIKSGAESALDVLKREGWYPDKFDHLILHQTSKMTLNSARKEINDLLDEPILHDENTINNLEERGNTASTSHFVALFDHIQNNRIKSGDKVVFGISASGLTTGTALYVFDDLPDRIREKESAKKHLINTSPVQKNIPHHSSQLPWIRVESIGTLPLDRQSGRDSLELLRKAAENCLNQSSHPVNDIGLLIHTGIYRSDNVLEPAFAALLAGELNLNASLADKDKKSLAFDIFNGSMGFLQACFIAQQMISAGTSDTAMIVATELENNAKFFPKNLIGICETASAILLDKSPQKDKGFSRFLFKYLLEDIAAYTVNCSTKEVIPFFQIEKGSELEEKYLQAIQPLVDEILKQEGIMLQEIDWVFPPQISSGFIKSLSGRIGLNDEKFIDIVGEGPDLFSSSIPFGMKYALENGLVKSGDIGLIIAVGSGLQIGCAIYHF